MSTKKVSLAVKKLAFEAYPQWAAAHPDTACPTSIDELLTYVPDASAQDPCGHPHQLGCGPTLPAGARGLAVSSLGPDGTASADDIASWK